MYDLSQIEDSGIHTRKQGWFHSLDGPAPHWHFIPAGTDRAICGEVWLPYGEPRTILENFIHAHPHPAECERCGYRAREKGRK